MPIIIRPAYPLPERAEPRAVSSGVGVVEEGEDSDDDGQQVAFDGTLVASAAPRPLYETTVHSFSQSYTKTAFN